MERIKNRSDLETLLDDSVLEQVKSLKNKVIPDYKELKKYKKENIDLPEDILLRNLVVTAWGCIQPVVMKRFCEELDYDSKSVKKVLKDYSQQIESRRENNLEFTDGTVNAKMIFAAMNTKASVDTVKFVKQHVLKKDLEIQEQPQPITIGTLNMNVTSEIREKSMKMVNSKPSENVYLNVKSSSLPKPTATALPGIIENAKNNIEALKEKHRDKKK